MKTSMGPNRRTWRRGFKPLRALAGAGALLLIGPVSVFSQAAAGLETAAGLSRVGRSSSDPAMVLRPSLRLGAGPLQLAAAAEASGFAAGLMSAEWSTRLWLPFHIRDRLALESGITYEGTALPGHEPATKVTAGGRFVFGSSSAGEFEAPVAVAGRGLGFARAGSMYPGGPNETAPGGLLLAEAGATRRRLSSSADPDIVPAGRHSPGIPRAGLSGWLGGEAGRVREPQGWRQFTALGAGLNAGSTSRWIGFFVEANSLAGEAPQYRQTLPVLPDTLGLPAPTLVVPGRPAVEWVDAGVEGALSLRRFGVFAAVQTRLGAAGIQREIWTTGGAWARLSDQLTLQASGGQQPGRPELGTATTSVASIGFRVSRRAVPSLRPVAPAAAGSEAHVARLAPDLVRLSFRLNARQEVELMGDFSQWQPMPMREATPGRWQILLPLGAGTYRMNIRVDGREWIAPPGLTTVRDEFGGVAGVLVVP